MDNHSLSEDVTNLSSPSQHRMPTVSAAQALENLLSSTTGCISTGLRGLDDAIWNVSGRSLWGEEEGNSSGGVVKGQVTEVYGPPGVGKTTFGLQLAVNTLRQKEGVVWVDATNTVPGPRLAQMLSRSCSNTGHEPSSSQAIAPSDEDLLDNLVHYTMPTLPEFVALLCNASTTFPLDNVNLIVVDSLSSLIASAFPRTPDNTTTQHKPGPGAHKLDYKQWAASQKWSVLQHIISSLQKLATLRNIAVVVLTQTITKMQVGSKASLIPAVTSTAWESGIATRIVLFRDYGWDGQQVRFAAVMKTMARGPNVKSDDGVGGVVSFVIQDNGLQEVQVPERTILAVSSVSQTPSRKRKADEIRDSEDEDDLEGSDEDYGWAEGDVEELPPPPSQWQGSEDILVPFPGVAEEEEEDEEEEEELVEEARVENNTPYYGDVRKDLPNDGTHEPGTDD